MGAFLFGLFLIGIFIQAIVKEQRKRKEYFKRQEREAKKITFFK